VSRSGNVGCGVPRESATRFSRFRVDTRKSRPASRPATSGENPAIPTTIDTTSTANSPDQDSLNSTTRHLAIPPDEQDDCWWALEEKRNREEHTTTELSKRTSHQINDTRRKHTNETSDPVLLKHDSEHLFRLFDHEFMTLLIAQSMLPCTIEFS
jgi:hypothetical protein